MKQKKRIRSITAITLWISCFTFILWAFSTYAITLATAESMYQAFFRQCSDYAGYVDMTGRFDAIYGNDESLEYTKSTPGNMDYQMMQAITFSDALQLNSNWRHDSIGVLRKQGYKFQTAVIFLDKDGNVLHESGDFVYFTYLTEEAWAAGSDGDAASGFAWFDLSYGEQLADPYDPYGLFSTTYNGVGSLYDFVALRITGHMKGAEIVPVKMSYVNKSLYRQAVESAGLVRTRTDDDGSLIQEYNTSVSDVDGTGLLDWQVMFDRTDEADNRSDLVTIYALYPWMSKYDDGGSINLNGGVYGSLLTMLAERGYQAYLDSNFMSFADIFRLDNITISAVRQRIDFRGYDFTLNEPLPEPDFIMLTAVSGSPLTYAISELRNVYIFSIILAILIVLILRAIINANLARPIETVNRGISDGWTRTYSPDDKPLKWREPYQLGEHYEDTLDKLRLNRNEMERMSAALNDKERKE